MSAQTATESAPPPPTATAPTVPTEATGTRNSVVLLVFTAITNIADGVTKIVLPLLAARLTDVPILVTTVSLALTLPWLLVALHVGVLVDRCDRRRLLWTANAMRLVAVGALIQQAVTDGLTLPVLCAAAAVLGVAEVIALTAAAAMIPALVPPTGRARANAWITGAETVCNEFCGPFVGGILLAAGTAIALGTTWVAYLAASLLLYALVGRFRSARNGAPATDLTKPPTGESGPLQKDTAAPQKVNQQIVEGLRYLWHQRLLRTMALILTVLCACWGGWLALMPLYATGPMALNSQQYGTLLGALGLGGLTGAIAVTRLNRVLGQRRVMFADLVGTFAMMAVPACTTNLWAVTAAAFIGGMGGTLWAVNARTISQNLVPDPMLGRYNAVSRLFSWGAMPVGAGLIGVVAQWAGMRTAFLVFAAATVATVVPFLRVLTRRTLAEAVAISPATTSRN
ncbi:MFS transporter [Streptomyces sp. TRM 70361]|uniref:MFS transporter n=1 Tax=Streptomyces sp. TRM 70361 TaxID=3116553 RepID=UPI002E7B4547|nr:MFS transporter [Streptomyces sp. TRM 70361]MEE1943024.1 MFS transporter [Streptomyces sp. TRM 70361]